MITIDNPDILLKDIVLGFVPKDIRMEWRNKLIEYENTHPGVLEFVLECLNSPYKNIDTNHSRFDSIRSYLPKYVCKDLDVKLFRLEINIKEKNPCLL